MPMYLYYYKGQCELIFYVQIGVYVLTRVQNILIKVAYTINYKNSKYNKKLVHVPKTKHHEN